MSVIRLWGLGLVLTGLVLAPAAYAFTIENVTQVTDLSHTGFYDEFGSLSPDGLTAYFSSNFEGGSVRMYASNSLRNFVM